MSAIPGEVDAHVTKTEAVMADERQTEPHQAEDDRVWLSSSEAARNRLPGIHTRTAYVPEVEVARLRAERDKLRSHVKQEQGLSNAMHLEIVAAEARVAELEGNLESERAQAAVEIEQLRQAQARVAELEAEARLHRRANHRAFNRIEAERDEALTLAEGVQDRIDRAVTEQRDAMLMWLRREDPSALKGYWPALHALETEFLAPTRTQEASDE